jgi:hypothetical protein
MEAVMADRAQSAGAQRVRRHRDKMKAAGLKPVTIWVPDVTSQAFQDDIRQQCRSLTNDPHEQAVLAEIDALADCDGWR